MVIRTEQSLIEWNQILGDNPREAVKNLMAKRVNVNMRDAHGNTLLHTVTRTVPEVALVQLLVKAGANVNALNNAGWAPLHVAVIHNHYKQAQFLLESGADVNAAIKEQEDDTALHLTAQTQNTRMARLLIYHGAELNAYGEDGTPLNAAQRTRTYALVRLLTNALRQKEQLQNRSSFSNEPHQITTRRRIARRVNFSREYV